MYRMPRDLGITMQPSGTASRSPLFGQNIASFYK